MDSSFSISFGVFDIRLAYYTFPLSQPFPGVCFLVFISVLRDTQSRACGVHLLDDTLDFMSYTC